MAADSERYALDPGWIARLRQGDEAAFAEVYNREKSVVYTFVLRLSRDPSVAADLFQNVWLKLARHASTLRDDSNLRAWLLTVARREYLSFRRAQALDLSRLLVLGLAQNEPAEHPADSDARALGAALDQLSDADREVLLLCAGSGLDSAALAATLGISGVALRKRLARARQRLAERLDAEAEEPRPHVATKGAR